METASEMMEINSVDLFSGGGGATTGMSGACRKLRFRRGGLAINHWSVAVETMRANHPYLTTLDCKIEEAIPAELIHGKVHILWASPSCTHHSRACGGKPRSNQLRSQPDFVTTWLTQCDVDNVIVENVPEFMEWGPLDDNERPDPAKKGLYFKAWVDHIRNIGYNVKYDVLCCADYGDATTRKRFFLIATKKEFGEPEFPVPRYGKGVAGRKPWRGACECIDFGKRGSSIFGRKKPLVRNTLEKIAVGARRYWGIDVSTEDLMRASIRGKPVSLKPFIVKLNRNQTVESIDDPVSTIVAGARHHMLCEPLILGQYGGSAARPASEPCPTIATKGAVRKIECDVSGGKLDILVRMLEPEELAKAHSFPGDYFLAGTKKDKTMQVGNSVPVRTAEALCENMLRKYLEK